MMSSASLTHKRLAALVPAINEAADGSDQVADAGEAAAADRLPVMIEKTTSTARSGSRSVSLTAWFGGFRLLWLPSTSPLDPGNRGWKEVP